MPSQARPNRTLANRRRRMDRPSKTHARRAFRPDAQPIPSSEAAPPADRSDRTGSDRLGGRGPLLHKSGSDRTESGSKARPTRTGRDRTGDPDRRIGPTRAGAPPPGPSYIGAPGLSTRVDGLTSPHRAPENSARL